MSQPGNLVIFAESGVRIGTGHVMRCLALAQAWKRRGGTVLFVLRESPILERIRAEGFSVAVLAERYTFSRAIDEQIRSNCRLAVLDGYGFDSAEQKQLRDGGAQVLFFDDYAHAKHYSARWVLNQMPYATARMYPSSDPHTQLLLGPEYAQLRDEFLPWVGWKRSVSAQARKLLIAMGGCDADNASSKVMEALSSLAPVFRSELEVILAVGSSNPHGVAVRKAAERSEILVRVIENALDMPSLMAWADVAVAAAGGTSLELCYMGTPSLLFIAAENQRQVAESLDQLGAAVNAGATNNFDRQKFIEQLSTLLNSQSQRKEMSESARGLVDGLGADRVCSALAGREMKLRLACDGDCQLLFGWANDPGARSASFHPEQISWDAHQKWFSQRLQDPCCVIYIGTNDSGTALGQVRFQLRHKNAVLSINVAPDLRSEGWGTALIAFSTRSLVRSRDVERIDAFVKPNNPASIQLFQKSGYQQLGTETIDGQPALRFAWRRKEPNAA